MAHSKKMSLRGAKRRGNLIRKKRGQQKKGDRQLFWAKSSLSPFLGIATALCVSQ